MKSELLRNVGGSILARGANAAANLGFILIAAQWFSPEQVAVVAWIALLTAVVDAVKGIGSGSVLLRCLPGLRASGNPEAPGLVLTHLVWSVVPVAGVVAAGAVAYSVFGALPLRGQMTPAEWWMGLGIASGVALTNSNLAILVAEQQIDVWVSLSLATTLLQRLIPCLVTCLVGGTFDDFLAGSCLLTSTGWVLTLAPLRRSLTPWRPVPWPVARWWPEAKSYYGATLLRFAGAQVDQGLAVLAFEPKAIAAYYVIRRVFSLALLLIDAVADVLLPRLAAAAATCPDRARANIASLRRSAVYAGTVGCALIASNAGWMIPAVAGEAYAAEGAVMVLLSVAALLHLALTIEMAELLLFHSARSTLSTTAVLAATAVIASSVLGYLWGVRGLAAGMVAGYCAGLGMSVGRGRGASLNGLAAAALVVVTAGVLATTGFSPGTVAAHLAVAAFACTRYRGSEIGRHLRRLT